MCGSLQVYVLAASSGYVNTDAITDPWSGLKRFGVDSRLIYFVLTPDVKALAHGPV